MSVGQVLDTGEKSGDACVMTFAEIEVEVDVTTVEPRAGLALEIDDRCQLTVVESYRHPVELDPPRALATQADSGDDPPRYKAMAKSEWSDLVQLDVAAVYVRYTYDEEDDGFSFVGSSTYQCVKAAWWQTHACRMDSKSASSSQIKATSYGKFSLKVTGRYRHSQKPTFTAKANGKGKATCWTSTNLSHLRFHCDGKLTRIN